MFKTKLGSSWKENVSSCNGMLKSTGNQRFSIKEPSIIKYASVLRHLSLRHRPTWSWVDGGGLWLGNLSRYPGANLSEWGWDLMGRRPDAAVVWKGRPRLTDSRPFVMEKSCLSWPSHPSPLLDPIINTIVPSLPPLPPPPTPPLPSYPLLFRLILLSPPPHPSLLSLCHLVHGQITELTAPLLLFNFVSSQKGAGLFLNLVFDCLISLKACVFWAPFWVFFKKKKK